MENFSYSEWIEGQQQHYYWPQNHQLTAVNNKTGFHFPEDRAYNNNNNNKSCSKSHSQAEKRRRDRINAQFTTLRKLIPNSDKMDKAALLGSVVERVKDLKRKALEASDLITVPSDFDEVTIECYIDEEERLINGIENKENIFIKASFCCEDRCELLTEINQALKGLKMTIVRGDMACLGGRIKSILVLCLNESSCITSTIQALKGVLKRIIYSSPSGSSYNVRSKRQRLLLSSSS